MRGDNGQFTAVVHAEILDWLQGDGADALPGAGQEGRLAGHHGPLLISLKSMAKLLLGL